MFVSDGLFSSLTSSLLVHFIKKTKKPPKTKKPSRARFLPRNDVAPPSSSSSEPARLQGVSLGLLGLFSFFFQIHKNKLFPCALPAAPHLQAVKLVALYQPSRLLTLFARCGLGALVLLQRAWLGAGLGSGTRLPPSCPSFPLGRAQIGRCSTRQASRFVPFPSINRPFPRTGVLPLLFG